MGCGVRTRRLCGSTHSSNDHPSVDVFAPKTKLTTLHRRGRTAQRRRPWTPPTPTPTPPRRPPQGPRDPHRPHRPRRPRRPSCSTATASPGPTRRPTVRCQSAPGQTARVRRANRHTDTAGRRTAQSCWRSPGRQIPQSGKPSWRSSGGTTTAATRRGWSTSASTRCGGTPLRTTANRSAGSSATASGPTFVARCVGGGLLRGR